MTDIQHKKSVSSTGPRYTENLPTHKCKFYRAIHEGKTLYLIVQGPAIPDFLKNFSKRLGNVKEVSEATWRAHASYEDLQKADQYVGLTR